MSILALNPFYFEMSLSKNKNFYWNAYFALSSDIFSVDFRFEARTSAVDIERLLLLGEISDILERNGGPPAAYFLNFVIAQHVADQLQDDGRMSRVAVTFHQDMVFAGFEGPHVVAVAADHGRDTDGVAIKPIQLFVIKEH